MFRKKNINTYSNLKKDLNIRTQIKSNDCSDIDIGAKGVIKV